MKTENNRILFVYFCFGIINIVLLSLSSCLANKTTNISKEVTFFFEQKKNESIEVCLNSDFELYEFAKVQKDKKVFNDMIKTCTDIASTFDVCEDDINGLLKTVYKKEKSNFIIFSITRTQAKVKNLSFLPTITAHRNQNEKEIHYISNHYKYDESKKKYNLIKDSNLFGFEIDERFKKIEDYLYHNNKEYVTDNMKEATQKFTSYTTCDVVAQIDGKYLIKELYLSE